MIKILNCPICEQSNCDKVATNSNFGFVSDVVRCVNCDFVFMKSQLDDKELGDFYHNRYRDQKGENFDEDRYLGDLERAISQLDFFKEFLNLEDKILDLGAGWGVNANYLYSRGYEGIIVNELDDKIESRLDGRIVRKSELITDIRDKYNFIIMSHSLEHLYGLQDKMLSIFNAIQEGGRLFIEVPNAKNNKLTKSFSESYHYWFFNMDNLARLAQDNGFEILKHGAFGKLQYVSEMSADDFLDWKRLVEERGISSVVQLPNDHERAYWLRILLERPTR